MLLHKNHLFIFKNVAGFQLPNGLCLEEDLPVSIENGIGLCAPDSSFNIEVCFLTSAEDDAHTYLEDVFREAVYAITEPIHAVAVNKVSGFAVAYETATERNEEYALDIPSGDDEHIILNIWFMQKKNVEQDERLYSKAKTELLDSITLLP